jgi:hypothetical protein
MKLSRKLKRKVFHLKCSTLPIQGPFKLPLKMNLKDTAFNWKKMKEKKNRKLEKTKRSPLTIEIKSNILYKSKKLLMLKNKMMKKSI